MEPSNTPEVYETDNTLLCAFLLANSPEDIELLGHERRANDSGRRYVVFRLAPAGKCREVLQACQGEIERLLSSYRRLVGITRGFGG